MIKKNIKIIAFLLMVITTSNFSCRKDILNQPPFGVQTDASFFKTSDDLNNVLTGAYSFLQSGGFYNFEVQLWVLGDIGSDDALKGGGGDGANTDMTDISYSRQNPSNSIVSGLYAQCYQAIAACNLVTDKASTVSGDPATIAAIVNQAKFLRAFFYYNLVTNFGAVPMPLTYLDPSKINLQRTSSTAVWAQIEKDLTDAGNLPTKSTWGSGNDGRATSGAAYALLGKAYMFQQKYSEAEAAFSKVISQNQYSLLTDYGKNWRPAGDNDNSESIFDIKHKANVPGEGSYSFTFLSSEDPQDGGFGFNEPMQNLIDEFEPGDPRVIYTVVFRGDVFPTSGANWTVQNANEAPYFTLNRKGLIPPLNNISGFLDQARSVHIIRYAEVLLLYAEALNENGKSAQALPYINQIRQRARVTPSSDPERISCAHSLAFSGPLLADITTTDRAALRMAIYHEERVELGEESHRREYLIRTGRLEARMKAAKNEFGVGTIDPHFQLLPIPLTEINLSNGVITQNAGY
jgi:tetratricopeptide (TPR) repeat protein